MMVLYRREFHFQISYFSLKKKTLTYINRLGKTPVDAYIYSEKAYLIRTSSCGSRALLFKRNEKNTFNISVYMQTDTRRS